MCGQWNVRSWERPIASESVRRQRLEGAILAEKAGFNLTRYTAWTIPQEDMNAGVDEIATYMKQIRQSSAICFSY